ncbi:MAG: hypothetical protein E6G79_20035 [Alphaproteobacteria bacterium]|nr:MAG: hypothetical protein E6G79_20035 [Alphaproteobacteria bacterium]
METQPEREENPELNNPPSDERNAAIEACFDLLSSGRPLSEILAELKRIPRSHTDNAALAIKLAKLQKDFDKVTPERAPTEPPIEQPTPIVEQAARIEPAYVEPAVEPSATIAEQPSRVDRLRERMAKRSGDASSPRFRRALWCGLIGSVAAGIFVLLIGMPVGYLPVTIAASAPPPPHVEFSQPAKEAWVDPPKDTTPVISAEQVSALLARGDALMGSADVIAARLFYERAALAGDSQSAVRLGATYDPDFIARAHVPVRGDAAAAAYWYAYGGITRK